MNEHSRDARREYLLCSACGLVFVPSRYFLSPEDEKKRYDLHRNSPDDRGYRRFLERLLHALHPRLAPASSGLDFGSGPEPLLAAVFREAGHAMTIYDPFYEPAPAALGRQYDFITASEVVEHLREPGRELDRLWNCLKPGGLLGIMTQPIVDRDAFPRWHYKNDLTHICFFSPGTFRLLAERWHAEIEFPEKDIAVFRKPKINTGNQIINAEEP
ncbi:MAG: class I SAM-dependent methyltransferase [Nitrospiraceae bacterium]|nr:class I SAM-dependent methyltransferase [Nitrospiraceae bacterium]